MIITFLGNRFESTLSGLLASDFCVMNQVELTDFPRSLKPIGNDEVWCCQDDGIVVYSRGLAPLRTVRLPEQPGDVHSVALLPDDTVAVAGFKLYQFTKSGYVSCKDSV